MKFRIYPWIGIDKQEPTTISFELFPSILFDAWLDKKFGNWITIEISWLIFGLTFDWRNDEEEE